MYSHVQIQAYCSVFAWSICSVHPNCTTDLLSLSLSKEFELEVAEDVPEVATGDDRTPVPPFVVVLLLLVVPTPFGVEDDPKELLCAWLATVCAPW